MNLGEIQAQIITAAGTDELCRRRFCSPRKRAVYRADRLGSAGSPCCRGRADRAGGSAMVSCDRAPFVNAYPSCLPEAGYRVLLPPGPRARRRRPRSSSIAAARRCGVGQECRSCGDLRADPPATAAMSSARRDVHARCWLPKTTTIPWPATLAASDPMRAIRSRCPAPLW